MSEYRKAKPEEREACIEFADYVFSKAHCPHDFETLIPRVYGEGVDSASMHRIAVDESAAGRLCGNRFSTSEGAGRRPYEGSDGRMAEGNARNL